MAQLTAQDLLAENGGIIEAGHMFPGLSEQDVLARLSRYLTEGYSYAVVAGSENDAARAYAYYTALTAVITRIATRPATQTVQGEVSRTYTSEQLRTLQLQANEWLLVWESYFPEPTEADVLDEYPIIQSVRR